MRLRDYTRLASAGLWRNRKQTIKVVLILGSMFAFILAFGFLVWGAEEVGISKINYPTEPKILVYIEVNTDKCDEICREEMNFDAVWNEIRESGGEIVAQAGSLKTKDGDLDVLPETILKRAIEVDMDAAPEGVLPILIPTRVAMEWLNTSEDVDMSVFNVDDGVLDFGTDVTVDLIESVREKALGRVIESSNNERYFVVGFLPSNMRSRFTMSTDSGLLNLFIDRTTVGNGRMPIVVGNSIIDANDTGRQRIWVTFDRADLAYRYYADQTSEMLTIASPFGFELDPKWSYAPTDTLFTIIVAIFGTLALLVNIVTLLRVIKRDNDVAVLYCAMGATPGQIRTIYGLRTLLLSLAAVAFALLVGTILCLVFNLVHAKALADVYALCFGTASSSVVLFGWKWEVLLVVGILLLAVPITFCLTWRSGSRQELSEEMKTNN